MSKFVDVGTDGSGQSAVLHQAALGPGVRTEMLVQSMDLNHEVRAAALDSTATFLDLREHGFDTAPGRAAWGLYEQAPGSVFPMHFTATTDLLAVLTGETKLILDTSEVDLAAGDYVVIRGAAHSWAAGPSGCVISSVVIGAPVHESLRTAEEADA